MKYTAKPHTIDAFYWGDFKRFDPPDWFKEAYQVGRVQYTENLKEKYITIYDKQGQKKAYPGDYICLSKHGVIFPLTPEEFNLAYC